MSGQLRDRINVSLQAVAQVLVVCGLGVYLARKHGLDRSAIAAVSNVNWHVLIPALMFSSIVGAVTPANLALLWPMLLASLLHILLGVVPALLLGWAAKLPRDMCFFAVMASSLPNCGNLPWLFMPSIIKYYAPPGEAAAQSQYMVGLVSVYTIITILVTLTVPFIFKRAPDTLLLPRRRQQGEAAGPQLPQLQDTSSVQLQVVETEIAAVAAATAGKQVQVRQLHHLAADGTGAAAAVNVPLGATVLGICCAAVGPVRGLLVDDQAPLHWLWLSLSWVGAAAAPLATMQIGAELMQAAPVELGMRVSRWAQWLATAIAILVKLLLVPLMNVAIIRTAGMHTLVPPEDKVYQLLLLVEAAVPAAVTLLVVCGRVYPDIRPLSQMLFWQYVASLVTLPAFLVWFMYMLEL
ncbi:hypothetical protein OEZ86_000100 [Tetradesmus obliquus]|nr:hypothetical protein OEZ86_000100 [Tetradesmus obliquus]